MSLAKFLNGVKEQANVAMNRNVTAKIGVVTNYDQSRYAVRVSLQPEEVETGWLPIFSPMVGNGWGFVCPPDVGTVAAVLYVDGNIDAGFVSLFCFGQQFVPPVNDVEPGGFLFYNKAGTQIKVSAAGEINIDAANAQTVNINSTALVRLGDKAGDFKKLVTEAFKELFNEHTHSGIGVPPDAQYFITDDQLTTVTKGN